MTAKPAWVAIVCGAVTSCGKVYGQGEIQLKFNFWIMVLAFELKQRRADDESEILGQDLAQ